MRKGLAGFTALLLLLCAMPPLYGEDESENAYLMETQGTPYQEQTFAQPPSGDFMMMDLLLVRPLSFAVLIIGSGLSILATPFAAVSGTTGPVYERLVIEPFDFTVRRPLGEF